MNAGLYGGFGERVRPVGGVTRAIVNTHSAGGTSTAAVSGSSGSGAREVLSGALSANALATLLTVNGSGRVPLLSAFPKDNTSRTVRLVVEVDGVTVFDATSEAVTVTGRGIFAAGTWTSSSLFTPSEPIVFSSSLVVKVASSLTETDKLAIAYVLHRS